MKAERKAIKKLGHKSYKNLHKIKIKLIADAKN